MGRAYQSLASYECHKALEQFSDLPPRHHNTGWVLVQVAKAHFELAQYQKVEVILRLHGFPILRQIAPKKLPQVCFYFAMPLFIVFVFKLAIV